MALVKLCQFKPCEDLAGYSLVQYFSDLLLILCKTLESRNWRRLLRRVLTPVHLYQLNPEISLAQFFETIFENFLKTFLKLSPRREKGENVKVFRRARVNQILLLIWNMTVNKHKIKSRSKILMQNGLQPLELKLVRPVLYVGTTLWQGHFICQGLWDLWRWCTKSLAAGAFRSVGKWECEKLAKKKCLNCVPWCARGRIVLNSDCNTLVSISSANIKTCSPTIRMHTIGIHTGPRNCATGTIRGF